MLEKAILFADLKFKLKAVFNQSDIAVETVLQQVCDILHAEVPYYDWVGYYFAQPEKKLLILKCYAGAPTEHTQIPFGKGICGQVALSNQNFLVGDVSQQNNYIACSVAVKSELVVPLFVNGQNIGQIDIDSHTKDAFSSEDESFLEWVNAQIALFYKT